MHPDAVGRRGAAGKRACDTVLKDGAAPLEKEASGSLG